MTKLSASTKTKEPKGSKKSRSQSDPKSLKGLNGPKKLTEYRNRKGKQKSKAPRPSKQKYNRKRPSRYAKRSGKACLMFLKKNGPLAKKTELTRSTLKPNKKKPRRKFKKARKRKAKKARKIYNSP